MPTEVTGGKIIQVQPHDVLCGRGGATNNHAGNRKFRVIVAHYQKQYLAARKRDKRNIAEIIVSEVRKDGGRFLKREADLTWVEVDDKKACEKTSQALREGLDVRKKCGESAKKTSPKKQAAQDNDTPPAKRIKAEEDAEGTLLQDTTSKSPAGPTSNPSTMVKPDSCTKENSSSGPQSKGGDAGAALGDYDQKSTPVVPV